MKSLNSVIRCFNSIEDFFMVWLTMGFGALIMVEIFVRTAGLTNIPWLEEFSRYMLVYTTLLGSSIAVKSEGHMAMDTLLVALPKGAVKVMKVMVNLVCLLCWSVIAYSWTMKLYRIGTSVSSVSLKMWIIWVPVILCCISTAVRFGIQLVKSTLLLAGKIEITENGGADA